MIAFIWGLLTSKLAGPIATAAALGLAVLLGVTRVELAGSRHHAEGLEASISAPVTGWAARLATCQANGVTLKTALDSQNAAVGRLKAESDARLAQSAKAVSAARSVAESFRQQAAATLAAKPTSPDACKAAAALIAEDVK